MVSPEQSSIVSGIGISRIGRRTGIPGIELTLESARTAIADAGITVDDLDGIATIGDTPVPDVLGALSVDLPVVGSDFQGGLLTPLMSAILAVAEGRARHVLVYRTVQMMGGAMVPPPAGEAPPAPPRPAPAPASSASGGAQADEAQAAAAEAAQRQMGGMGELMTYHAYSASNWLAMHCRRHMHLYGTTKEQLGALAVNSRANAALNPRAVYREPITLDDYLEARPVSDPFGLLDCDVPVDGSIALVISHADHASACDHAVRVAAIGGSPGEGGWYLRPDYPKMASVDATAQLWSRTDLKPGDVDFAELYDGFTYLTLAWLEAYGFCGDGEAGPFVAEPGRIALDGTFPLNTYGGQLSAGRMHGYWVVHEACLQLRGEAGDRQVARHEVAAVGTGGGPIAGAILLTA